MVGKAGGRDWLAGGGQCIQFPGPERFIPFEEQIPVSAGLVGGATAMLQKDISGHGPIVPLD